MEGLCGDAEEVSVRTVEATGGRSRAVPVSTYETQGPASALLGVIQGLHNFGDGSQNI